MRLDDRVIVLIVACGVLLDTFVVRSLLVRSMVYDLGDRVRLPARLTPRHARAEQGA